MEKEQAKPGGREKKQTCCGMLGSGTTAPEEDKLRRIQPDKDVSIRGKDEVQGIGFPFEENQHLNAETLQMDVDFLRLIGIIESEGG